MELWKSVATPEDYPSMRPPEVASHSFGGFVCGLLCGCVIISNGIMFPLSTIHCKTTQLVNKTVMNFSELYFSRCLLKRQKLLLRVFMLFKCNWLFTISFVFFFFEWSAFITFLLFICSLWEQWNIIFKISLLIVLRNKLQAFLIEKITLNIVSFLKISVLLASRQKFKWCKGKTSFLSKFLTDCSSPFLWDYVLSGYPFLPNLIIQTCEKWKC